MAKIEMARKVKELLKEYNVPNNVIGMVEDYYSNMVQGVIEEYEKGDEKYQEQQPKEENKPFNIAELAAEHRVIK